MLSAPMRTKTEIIEEKGGRLGVAIIRNLGTAQHGYWRFESHSNNSFMSALLSNVSLCVGTVLVIGRSPVQEFITRVYRIRRFGANSEAKTSWKPEGLTLRSRILIDKLSSSASQEIPCIVQNRRFITAFATARQQSPSSATLIESILFVADPFQYCSPIKARIFPSGVPITKLYAPLLSPIRVTYPTHLILIYLIAQIFGEEYRSWSSRSQ